MWKTLPDNIAQHSFFVTWYAVMIAETIRWHGPRDYLMLKAMYHDLDETITADITGPVKKEIVDAVKAEPYLEGRMLERMGNVSKFFLTMEEEAPDDVYFDVEKIVRAADLLEALLFSIVNEQVGNKAMADVTVVFMAKVEAAWRDLPAPPELLSSTWQTVCLPAIHAHRTTGGRGI